MQKPSCQGDRVRGSEPLQALSSKKRDYERAASLRECMAWHGIWHALQHGKLGAVRRPQGRRPPGGVPTAHAHGARMHGCHFRAPFTDFTARECHEKELCMHALVHMIERSLGCMGWRRRARLRPGVVVVAVAGTGSRQAHHTCRTAINNKYL
jgi:hypothetical protein